MYGRYLCSATRCILATKAFKPNESRRKSYFSASFGITLDVLAFAYSVVLCAHLSFGVRVRATKVAHMPQFCDLFRPRREQRPDKWMQGMLGKQNEPSSISQRRDASCSFSSASVTSSGDKEDLQRVPKSKLWAFVLCRKQDDICDYL